MEHLNYCRKIRRQFVEIIESANRETFDTGQYGATCRAIDDAEKFLLPDGGTLWSDKTFASMDDSIVLELPSKVIAIEFSNYAANVITKCLCIAFENTEENTIYSRLVLWNSKELRWRLFTPVCFPNVDYFQGDASDLDASGNRIVKIHVDGFDIGPPHRIAAWVVLSFMHALQCSNVRTEISLANQSAKTKIPFDSYKILKITSDAPGRRFVTEDFGTGTVIKTPEGKVWVKDSRKEH